MGLRAALVLVLALGVFAAPAAGDVVVGFRTPSGNIGCVYSRETGKAPYLRCDIRSRLRPTTWRRGGFVCASTKAGLRCRNRSGHGFFLSRQHSYRF